MFVTIMKYIMHDGKGEIKEATSGLIWEREEQRRKEGEDKQRERMMENIVILIRC